MRPNPYRFSDPFRRILILILLRCAVFLFVILSHGRTEMEATLLHWEGVAVYFALSEILLLVRSGSSTGQDVLLGIYFIDLFVLTSWGRFPGDTGFAVIPGLIVGTSLCYRRKWGWWAVAFIPSALLLYRRYEGVYFPLRDLPAIFGMFFFFLVLAWAVQTVSSRLEEILSLYRGQRKLVERLSSVLPAPSLDQGIDKILRRDPPLSIDLFSILIGDSGGELHGRERRRDQKVREVRIGAKRIPSIFFGMESEGTYIPDLPAKEQVDFFSARQVQSLFAAPLRFDGLHGVILYGRRGKDAFGFREREILTLYAEMVRGWLRLSYDKERSMAGTGGGSGRTGDVPDVSGRETRKLEPPDLERIRKLEEENLRLKQTLDEEVRQAAYELKKATLASLSRESRLNQKVLDRLASAELSQAVSMLFDLDLILDLILDVICKTLSVENASIMLLREETGELVIRAHRGISDEIVRKTRLMVGEAIAGYVAQKKEPLLIEDIRKDPRFVPFHRERYRSGTLLSVPILHEGRVLGVINLSDPRQEGPFLPRDLEFIQALSRQAAFAIENDRLYNEFENGRWIREVYEERLTRKVSEKVFREEWVLEELEGECRVTVLAVHLHEDPQKRETCGIDERLRKIEGSLREVRKIVSRHRGDVSGETGAGLIGVFGLPFADSQDPWRSVLAAVDLLRTFSTRDSRVESAYRDGIGISVGVATGQVLMRKRQGTVPYALFGETWERAMALMHAASPRQILIDEETFERIRSRVNVIRLMIPYGINREFTVYGIKGLKKDKKRSTSRD